MLRAILLSLVLLAAAAWGAFGRPSVEGPSRRNPRPEQESGNVASLPEPAHAARPALMETPAEVGPQPTEAPLADLQAVALEWAGKPTTERVEEAIRSYRQSSGSRTRAIALYILARSRRTVAHAERDDVLANEALPFLRDVALSPSTDATRPAILALSALGDPEAARTLALASLDPREPEKGVEALSALVVRPDRYAVAALEDLARDRVSGAARLRAVRALVSAAKLWGPQAEDLESRAALSEARRFLEWEAPAIAESIGRATRVAALREDASALAGDIRTLFHGTNP